MNDQPLWPTQTKAIDLTHSALNDGHRRVLLTSPTGSGKSRICCELIRDWLVSGLKVGLYTNRKMLIEQLSRTLNQFGLTHGTRSAAALGPNEMPSDLPVQISSIQTEHSRVMKKKTWQLHDADRILVDECFVLGTKISTPNGDVIIDNVRPGDKVSHAFGVGTVLAVSQRMANQLYLVEFDDGSSFTCTGNHRVFTDSGWQCARDLEGKVTFSIEAVRNLRENMEPEAMGQQAGLRSGYGGNLLARAASLFAILRQEGEEPDAQLRNSAKGSKVAAGHETQASSKGRKRPDNAAVATGPSVSARGRVGKGTSGRDGDGKRQRLSDLLQDRRGQPRAEGRLRDRRKLSCGIVEEGTGRKENEYAGVSRVVRVSRLKRSRPRTVLNLHVSGHPSYFANGKLVHNCHLNKSDMAKGLLDKHLEAGASYVGLTATPFDLGHMYEHLIVAGTNSELRDCGALVPAIHYGPDEPDCTKIKKNAWEYTENDVRKVMKVQNIIGRMSEWFGKLNPEQKPTILFAPGVPESLWCAQEFSKRGVPSAHIDGESCWLNGKEYPSGQSIRDDIRAMSKSGEIKIVMNRFCLREGIDFPWLEYAILATVFGSIQSYVQSVGRILRASPSTGKKFATLIDHGGNWHRMGSANMDRQWTLDMTEGMMQNARAQELREKKQTEPMRCPQCAKIMMSTVCSGCGFKITHKTRPVIGDDGELRQHLGDIFPQRKIKEPPNVVELWTGYYYRAKNSRNGMTFNQAEGLFYYELHYYPPRNLPLMPTNPLDWSRRVRDVPRERLIQPQRKA